MAEVYLDSILIGKVANKANYVITLPTTNNPYYLLTFNGNNTFTPYIQLNTKSILIVGGGGGGGHGGKGQSSSYAGNGGGGGGGGCGILGKMFFNPEFVYNFTIGNGGESDKNGESTIITHLNGVNTITNIIVNGGNAGNYGGNYNSNVYGVGGGNCIVNNNQVNIDVVMTFTSGKGGDGKYGDGQASVNAGDTGYTYSANSNVYGNGGSGGHSGGGGSSVNAANNTGNGGNGGDGSYDGSQRSGGKGGSGVIILTFDKNYIDGMIEQNTKDYVNFEKNIIKNNIQNDIQTSISNKINVPNYSGGITVGYSPTDFYYVMANEAVPTDVQCQTQYTTVLIPDASCIPTDSHWATNKDDCLKKELCKNKANAQRIQNIQNNHLGSDQHFNDTMTLYKNEYAKMVNLSVGILVIAIVIFYSK